MSKPVTVNLVFPRSGQQVTVYIASHLANDGATSNSEQSPNRMEICGASHMSNANFSARNDAYVR